MDPFTEKRLLKFVADFRARSGTFPAFKDFEESGFTKEIVEDAVKGQLLEMLYVTLTNGSVVKTYRIRKI